MPATLHILTRRDAFADGVIALQMQSHPDSIRVIDLDQPEPDYDQLLDAVFEADHISVW